MPDAQALDPTDPVRLGGYRVTGRIGAGGQGVVYLGESETGEPVAIKLFHAVLDDDPALRHDFLLELDVAKRVARFCTAQVLESGIAGGRPYIVSEYVPGLSLQQVVRAEGPRSGSALERLAIGTATALVSLHDAGIVHRDFKPQNILLGPDGPRVIDFGIARALTGTSTMTSRIVGTPAYMAPEQLAGKELGTAMDVFAWASTITFAATGRPPFGDDDLPAIINRILNAPPQLDGIEASLRDLLTECLDKDPARRPSAQQILDRLVRRTNHDPAVAAQARAAGAGGHPGPGGPTNGPPDRPTAPGQAGGTAARRRRGVRAGGAVTAALVVIGGIAAMVTLRDAEVSTPPAAAADANPATQGTTEPKTASPHVTPTATATRPSPKESPTQSPLRHPMPPTHKPSSSDTTRPSRQPTTSAEPTSTTKPLPPTPAPAQLTELGPAHFTAYCQTLGWEWVEYRETPQPGAYCVMRKGQTMYLTQQQRDAGCRWRFKQPHAFHRFKSKSNYCYIYS